MSYLIDRAFVITQNIKNIGGAPTSKTHNNRAILLKVLYTLNPEQFLQCFKSD